MRPQSAKAKGRRLQQFVRDAYLRVFPSLEPDDVRSTSMGASGEDILLSPAARALIPFSTECKNVEKINIWAAIKQAESGEHPGMVVFTRNGADVYAVLQFEGLLDLLGRVANAEEKAWMYDDLCK